MKPDKSFAEKQLHKHGWKSGQGLGRNNHGIKDAIKVKRKNNTNGLGHDQGKEFTYHWWDHIFNKTAKSIKVESDSDNDEIKIKRLDDQSEDMLKFKADKKKLLYGNFVRGGSYKQEENLGKSSSKKSLKDKGENSDSDYDDDNNKISEHFGSDTLEKTFQLTGLTGHKAARHGHQMSGKLKRTSNQENCYVESSKINPSAEKQKILAKDSNESTPRKKKKKKRKTKHTNEES